MFINFQGQATSQENNTTTMNSELFQDTLNGLIYGVWYSRYHMIHSFVIIPAGLLVLLSILYGFNILLSDIAKVNFPSSVLCMLINLVILITLKTVSNIQPIEHDHKNNWKNTIGHTSSWILEHYLMIIRPPMNFSLKWINVFFIPSFIVLPLSEPISIIECSKIGAIFVIGGITLMMINIYLIACLRKTIEFLGISSFFPTEMSISKIANEQENEGCEKQSGGESIKLSQSYILAAKDITTINICSLKPARTFPERELRQNLQSKKFLGSPHSESINLQVFTTIPIEAESSGISDISRNKGMSQNTKTELDTRDHDTHSIETGATNKLSKKAQSVAIFITNYIDWILYIALFCTSLPFYYINAIHVMLPFHLGLTVISYYIALHGLTKFPTAKKFAHPILILTAEILFVCFISSLIYHRGSSKGFLEDLKYYKTGKNYLNLFNGRAMFNNGDFVPDDEKGFTSQPMWPGCGDFLSSLMDISIVSLSLPMFTHRNDFIKNFWVLFPLLLSSICLTFFCYPIICYKIGLSLERSIGFIGRLVTLALGTPLIDSLGGSVSLMAVCTILSGICGVLIGDPLFKLLRISANDYVTRGVTLGVNCGAIATAHLLDLDPRAAAMSSLSFSLFGTFMIILASIGTIRDMIRGWVGL